MKAAGKSLRASRTENANIAETAMAKTYERCTSHERESSNRSNNHCDMDRCNSMVRNFESHKCVGLDTETILRNGTHTFFSLQIYGENSKEQLFTMKKTNVEKLFTHRFESTTFLALNAEFDIAVISQVLDLKKFELKTCYNKGRFLFGTVTRGHRTWKIYDLGNIFVNWSLAKIGDFLKFPKLEKPHYLGIRAPQTQEEFESFKAYAMRDAEICFHAGEWLKREFGKLRATAPSFALHYFAETPKAKGVWANYSDLEEKAIRQAYHGGRTEDWIRGTPDAEVFCYDVVSLYPYVMATFPFPLAYNQLEETRKLRLEAEGVAYVLVNQKATIPLLCIKKVYPDKTEKLVFPNGTFWCWATIPELRYFTEQKLGQILDCRVALYAKRKRLVFQDYVEHFFKKKQSDPSHATFYKLMLNSLYGKFGQRYDTQTLRVVENGKTLQPLMTLPKPKIRHDNVLIAAYVTAYARIHMHKLYTRAGAENICYTDTDSIHTLKPISWGSDRLGGLAFKLKGQATYVRSKFYLIDDKVYCKGMEKVFPAAVIRAMIKHGNVSVLNKLLLRMRAANKRHKPFLTVVEQRKRFSLTDDGKRVYDVPLDAEELLTSSSLSNPLTLEAKEK